MSTESPKDFSHMLSCSCAIGLQNQTSHIDPLECSHYSSLKFQLWIIIHHPNHSLPSQVHVVHKCFLCINICNHSNNWQKCLLDQDVRPDHQSVHSYMLHKHRYSHRSFIVKYSLELSLFPDFRKVETRRMQIQHQQYILSSFSTSNCLLLYLQFTYIPSGVFKLLSSKDNRIPTVSLELSRALQAPNTSLMQFILCP